MAKYLVVDDSPSVRLALSAAIASAKGPEATFELVEASGAAQAKEAFGRDSFDAVFLDLNLGGEEAAGGQLLDWMLERQPHARILLVTGLPGDHPQVVRCIQAGAFAYLPKPIRRETVAKAFHQIEVEEGRYRRIK